MTDKKSLEALAKRIAKKAVSDDYVEDGGYIRDWLYDDLLDALLLAQRSGLEMGAEIAMSVQTENGQYYGGLIANAIRAKAQAQEGGK